MIDFFKEAGRNAARLILRRTLYLGTFALMTLVILPHALTPYLGVS